jgi:hypothetical protein
MRSVAGDQNAPAPCYPRSVKQLKGPKNSIPVTSPSVASARAAKWTSRAAKPTMTKPREVVPNLEAVVRAANVADMTASFLAAVCTENLGSGVVVVKSTEDRV